MTEWSSRSWRLLTGKSSAIADCRPLGEGGLRISIVQPGLTTTGLAVGARSLELVTHTNLSQPSVFVRGAFELCLEEPVAKGRGVFYGRAQGVTELCKSP